MPVGLDPYSEQSAQCLKDYSTVISKSKEFKKQKLNFFVRSQPVKKDRNQTGR